jgi:uncharacterized protein
VPIASDPPYDKPGLLDKLVCIGNRGNMLDTPTAIAAAVIAVIIVGFAKGGFSGLGALATPIMALAMPPVAAAAVLLPILIVQDIVGLWSFRGEWNRRILAWMLPGAVAGVAIGWLVAAKLTVPIILATLGAITLGFGLWRFWIERSWNMQGGEVPASNAPEWLGILFGTATGFTSQIAHAGGPPFQMWVAPKKLPHTEYVGTNILLFAVLNWVKVPAYIQLGQLHAETLWASLYLTPLAIVSTVAGVILVKRLNGPLFYKIINVLMILLGARLLWAGIFG